MKKIKNILFGSTKRKIITLLSITFISLFTIIIVLISITGPLVIDTNPISITHLEGEFKRSDRLGMNSLTIFFTYNYPDAKASDPDIRSSYVITNNNSVIFPMNTDNHTMTEDKVFNVGPIEYLIPGGSTPVLLVVEPLDETKDQVSYQIDMNDIDTHDIYTEVDYLSITDLYSFGVNYTPYPTHVNINPQARIEALEELYNEVETFINDPDSGNRLILDKADISIALPKTSFSLYKETQPKGEDYEMGGVYDVPFDCKKLDPTTLKITDEEFYCKHYTLDFVLFSSNMVYTPYGNVDIYLDGYEKYLLSEIVDTGTTIIEKPVNILGKDYVIKEYKDSSQGDILTINFLNKNGKAITLIFNYFPNINPLLTKDKDLFWRLGEAIVGSIK